MINAYPDSFTLRPLHPNFGAEIVGLDLSQPLSAEMFDRIYRVFLDYQLILFRHQNLSPGAQVAFARHFGEVQVHVMDQYHAADYPELYTLSNLDAEGNPSGKHPDKGTLSWHTDGSWRQVTGQATIMYSVELPGSGGDTHFCDMYSAYEQLSSQWQQRLHTLQAIHNLDFSRNRRHGEQPMSEAQKRQVPPVAHPVVRTHSETRRRCIYLGDHAETIVGMDYAEGRALVEQINAMIVRPERVYEHHWQTQELLIWDNRCLLHRATPYDTATERRVIRRCTVLGEVPE